MNICGVPFEVLNDVGWAAPPMGWSSEMLLPSPMPNCARARSYRSDIQRGIYRCGLSCPRLPHDNGHGIDPIYLLKFELNAPAEVCRNERNTLDIYRDAFRVPWP